jgi:uncharacterized membrane protein YfcA
VAIRLFRTLPELTLLIVLAVTSYVAMAIFAELPSTDVLSGRFIVGIIVASFLFSTAIAVVAVIAGVGGGVLFTPVMMGFTSIDTLIIRATGLVVAMFSGLISTGPFMRKGLADIKIVYFCSVPIAAGALAGAFSAVALSEYMGDTGDAVVRLLLGLILIFIAAMFVLGGSKTEYPEVERVDRFTQWIGLHGAYWEESLGRRVDYSATRSILGFLLFSVVGFTGGFFGLGGGWAVVPVLNLVMMVPLKISAACSGVLLAIGNAVAIWPYVLYGALLALFVVPWMLGQVIGGILGAHILARIKAGFVRKILILLIIATSIKLVQRGIGGLL